MTKDEMIQQKVAKIVQEEFQTIYFYCRQKAQDKLKTELYMTRNQKQRLTEALTAIKNATGHKYSTLTYICDDINDKKVFLGFYNTETVNDELQKMWHYDMISGTLVSFADEIFVNHQEYHIDDLIEDSLAF